MCQDALVICPVYNEKAYLQSFCERLRIHCASDVLFINDGSTDGSGEILRKMEQRCNIPRISLVTHPFRRGYGAALLTGFQYALSNDYHKVVTLDADLQHQPEDICRFVSALDLYDVALGSRYSDERSAVSIPRSRFLINRYISAMLKKYIGATFSDPFCGFRGYRMGYLEGIHLREQSYGICLEMLMEMIRSTATYCEIPVACIYVDDSRRFYDGLNDPLKRLNYYKKIVWNKLQELKRDRITAL
jgi:dolichol-phosphate mannosyltransferase